MPATQLTTLQTKQTLVMDL